jgi:hypothetical protein
MTFDVFGVRPPAAGIHRLFHRRPARDYETLPARSEAVIHLAMPDLMASRITTWGSTPQVSKPGGRVRH